ncbi:malformin synthetase mlfA-like [Coccinella septempunctata]|uniref:malformin synthetase mlfA-like n=1 Tax=Coccinella septempunctata TaxID=41139 RepID=UPI001D081219|nr:malformin synthetase mlfA-like [Coccinella septempunctata]
MKRFSGRVAQYIVETDEEQTFSDLLHDCIRVAINLRADDFSEDDILGISCSNRKETCIPYIAALFIGIKVIAFDTSLSVEDRVHLLHEVTPKIIFVETEILSSVRESIDRAQVDTKIVVIGDEAGDYCPFEEYLEASDDEICSFEPVKLKSNRETAAILFSSGTTGLPKGICLSHYGILSQALLLVLSGTFGTVSTPVALTFSQLYWISAIVFLIGSTVSGTSRVIMSTFYPDELWTMIGKYRITVAFLSPFQCLDLSKSTRPEGVDTSSLHVLATGGGPISENLVHSLRDILPGTFVLQLYGQTEVCGASTMFQTRRIDDQLLLHYKPKSVGRPMPGFWLKVVNTDSGEIVGPNEHGELRIKSDFLMNGYYKRDCSEAFDENGWFRSGDVAYYDEFDCFYIIDRIKEMLKFRGWHVQPALLENILMLHPAVKRAVVVGIPNDEDGDHPLGLVVLNEDYSDVDPKALELFVEERVQDRQRLRAGVKIIDTVPITNTGKIKRLLLRNAVINVLRFLLDVFCGTLLFLIVLVLSLNNSNIKCSFLQEIHQMERDNSSDEDSNPLIIVSEELDGNEDYFGIGYELFNHMRTYRKNNAQCDMFTRTVESYDHLLRKAICTAVTLKSLKLPDDPIIAILANNHPNTSVAIIGSHLLGYRVNAYDCLLRDSDFGLLLQQIPPAIMFIDEQFVEKMETAMKLSGVQVQLIVFGQSDKYKVFHDFCIEEGIDSFKPVKLQSGKETAVIMFSSGTTGLPKGICLSHKSLLKQSFCLISMLNLKEDSVFLHFSGYNWITSHIILFACIFSGASRVISPITSAWDAIDKHKVTHIYAPPHVIFLLLRQDASEPQKNSSVKCFITAGSRLNNALSAEVKNIFTEAHLSQSYGQTEATGWITIFQWHKKEDILLADRNPDSVGRLFPGFSCKIVDIASQEIVGPNQIGEIRLKSKSFFMNGYYKKDSSDNFDSAGWLKTGDLGYYNEDKCFFIVGRCKELIKYQQFHIRPQKLENILESHPAVEKAVVIGITHPIDGEHPKGIVVLRKGKEDISAKDIKSFVDDQVEERLKLRGGVQIVEDIPMTSTGKPKRNELKKFLESEHL